MPINTEWEQFLGGPTVRSAFRFHITINRRGRISFNERTYVGMGKPQAVNLFFSRERNLISVKPTGARLNTAFPVRPRIGRGFIICAAPFCQHFGVKIDATYRFTAPEIDPVHGLILNLSETVVVTRKTTPKR
jgi:hypothetical protein